MRGFAVVVALVCVVVVTACVAALTYHTLTTDARSSFDVTTHKGDDHCGGFGC